MKKEEKSGALLANLMLITAALIWGSGSVFQKIVCPHIGSFTFYGLRCILGAVTLAILVLVNEKNKRKKEQELGLPHSPYGKEYFRRLLTTAPLCTFANITGNVLTQFGIRFTTVGKTGFLTAIYIIFVPLLSLLIFKKHVSRFAWIGTALTVFGLYFLCIKDGFTIEKGDLIVLVSTIPIALHIQLVSKYVRIFTPVHFTFVEFSTAAVFCTTMGLLFEETNWQMASTIIPGLLYCGILGIGICYALQGVAQRRTNPTVAALLMSLESVFAALSGVIFLNESFSGRELIGVFLICCAVVLAQLPEKKKIA
ncbi:MAG: DMT family transporter [Clostridia bacterium]|nr:DMT family transporter [Clostridia bacterium]